MQNCYSIERQTWIEFACHLVVTSTAYCFLLCKIDTLCKILASTLYKQTHALTYPLERAKTSAEVLSQ